MSVAPAFKFMNLLPIKIITELKTCLLTGYQLHVRTFTLHTVLKTVADSYVPPNPPSVDVHPSTSTSPDTPSTAAEPAAIESTSSSSSTSPVADGVTTTAMNVEGGDAEEAAPTAVTMTVPAVPSSLVRPSFDACIPEIVELLMEDLFGESAAAKEVSDFRGRGWNDTMFNIYGTT